MQLDSPWSAVPRHRFGKASLYLTVRIYQSNGEAPHSKATSILKGIVTPKVFATQPLGFPTVSP
jgi:hypothetical protein